MTGNLGRILTNTNIGYRLRTASMETPHVTTVGAAISRPKGLNHCAFPAKRGALEAVRFRAADMYRVVTWYTSCAMTWYTVLW